MAKAVDLEKSDHSSVGDRQFLQRFVQFFLKLPEVGITVGTPLIRQLFKDLSISSVLVNLFQTEKTAQTILTEMAKGGVDRDLIEPGEKRAMTLKPVYGLERLDKSILGKVGRVLTIGRKVVDN